MRMWPPLLWLPVFVGSLFVLLGATGPDPLLVIGAALIGVAFVAAVAIALRPSADDDPRPQTATVALVALGVFYLLCAIAAGVGVGWEYGLVALAAGAVPATAVAILVATMGPKDDADADDSLPGLGADAKTPLGDTSELSDANDLAPEPDSDPRFPQRDRRTRARH
jgi:hypothetical protein